MSQNIPKIFVRKDQKLSDISIQKYQDDCVTIFAPQWVREGLEKLSEFIPIGTKFNVFDSTGKHTTITVDGTLNLKLLTMIARNEPKNTSGKINFSNYEALHTNNAVIYALKDLVRQCVIVGKDKTTHYGGFPRGTQPVKQSRDVYVADLTGLQFKHNYNSGRLVLVSKHLPKGLLDELIFENIVGEKKKSYVDVVNDKTGRYVKHKGAYFDTIAYKRFVANDVLITGLALNLIADKPINFKFLRYGCGFFAGAYRHILDKHIYMGLAEGLSQLFSKNQQWIKSIELPFYKFNKEIDHICKMNKIECKFSNDDALKQTHPKYITATTNCADPHAITGNELGYTSVDGAIAKNLESKAKKFSPIINRSIREKFIDVNNWQ